MEKINNKKKKLYSFSAYGTILTRTTATKDGVYLMIQDILNKKYKDIPVYIRENFSVLRADSEKLARKNSSDFICEEVNLHEIYMALSTTGLLTDKQIELLEKIELEVERENVLPIVENVEKLKRAVINGSPVVIIEDTYYSSHELRNILSKIDDIFMRIPIYVSSEYKKNKRIGTLYPLVREMTGSSYDDWIHIGNDEYSDYKSPRRYGITCELYDFCSLLDFERNYIKHNMHSLLPQRQIGMARNLRVSFRGSISKQIGQSYGGQILIPYVHWIIKNALDNKWKCLYFIARDGYILKKIADIFIKEWNLPITTKYVYGSRKVWRLSGYTGKENELIRIIMLGQPHKLISIRKLAAYLNILPDELLGFLPTGYYTIESNFSYHELCMCILNLDKNTDFRKYLLDKYKKERDISLSYLKQTIKCDENYAFVELTGSGLTSDYLALLMRHIDSKNISVCYFRLDCINVIRKANVYTFIPSKIFSVGVLELLCRALHGQTKGYHSVKGIIEPILKNDENELLIDYNYQDYINGVCEFACSYSKETKFEDTLKIGQVVFFLNNLDYSLVDYFANMPFCSTNDEEKIEVFAPKLSKKDIRNLFFWHAGREMLTCYKGSALELSLLRASDYEIKKIEFYKNNRSEIGERFNRLWHKSIINKYDALFQGVPFQFFGKNVVVYGAGELGNAFLKKISGLDVRVVAWLDKNYERGCQEESIIKGGIENIRLIDFDVVWIAIMNPIIVREVEENLKKYGVQEEKIKIVCQISDEIADYKRYLN